MTDQPDQTRRRLLVGVSLASANLGPSVTGAEAAEGPEATAPADPRQPRFETTEHVANFYRLARS